MQAGGLVVCREHGLPLVLRSSKNGSFKQLRTHKQEFLSLVSIEIVGANRWRVLEDGVLVGFVYGRDGCYSTQIVSPVPVIVFSTLDNAALSLIK